MSCVCKWFDDIAKRVLWKEFCHTRAPKMMLDLQSSGSHSVDGNWKALAKLLVYCSGSRKGGLFDRIHVPGHFVYRTRFSRTSGKSFLISQSISNPIMSCMFQTLVSILIKEMKVMLVSSVVSSSHFLFLELGRCSLTGMPNSMLLRLSVLQGKAVEHVASKHGSKDCIQQIRCLRR
ncbi:EID1-like F-box protein 2 [Iris pallida]|uniref:EID1-like F-box protein 2 n=1 Tax=Iris pallida TaxID=29817 RepID=A0AAX6F044_IRIPA|nr:EID1-like F-box protein 2 [Iris pallida]